MEGRRAQPSGLRALARFQLSVRLFPHCLDDIPAPSQIPGDLRKAVDVHPRQVPETLAAWRFRIQCCGSQDVRRRSRLPTPIELIDEAIPDLFSIRRARVHRGHHVARRPTVVAHGLTDSRTGSVREARTPCSSTTLTTRTSTDESPIEGRSGVEPLRHRRHRPRRCHIRRRLSRWGRNRCPWRGRCRRRRSTSSPGLPESLRRVRCARLKLWIG